MIVIGQPIHYYHQEIARPSYSPQGTAFSFFRPYLPSSPPTMEMEEYPMVMSPCTNSAQSDSENSVSSVEVYPQPIELPSKGREEENRQCLWRGCSAGSFPTLTDLANHVARSHASGGRDGLFHCGWEGCARNNKGFNARYKMLVHVRTHTNEKPHKCHECDKSFSRAENLKIHSRSHSGEKPYRCPVPGCGKAYSNSSDRFKHTRTHSVEKPYRCKVEGCPKRYTDPSSLRKHVKTYKHFTNPTIMEHEQIVENHVPVIRSTTDEDENIIKVHIDIKNDPYNLYKPYEHEKIDRPLDLSVKRH